MATVWIEHFWGMWWLCLVLAFFVSHIVHQVMNRPRPCKTCGWPLKPDTTSHTCAPLAASVAIEEAKRKS